MICLINGLKFKKSVPLGYDTLSLGVKEECPLLHNTEDKGTTQLQNVGNCAANSTLSHPRRIEFSA
jgi:hypothetical protein